jgi:hypothetical protein
MADVEDRQSMGAERRQQVDDPVERVRVVALAPGGILLGEALLNIDDDQSGAPGAKRGISRSRFPVRTAPGT